MCRKKAGLWTDEIGKRSRGSTEPIRHRALDTGAMVAATHDDHFQVGSTRVILDTTQNARGMRLRRSKSEACRSPGTLADADGAQLRHPLHNAFNAWT